VIAPRVSFIVITHARAEWLPGALESIRRQTIDSREILVVVNGPDQATEQVLRAHRGEIRTTTLDRNRGVGAGRNAGITLAQGEILFFLDDDAELADANTVARILTHFERDPDLGIVGFLVIDAATGSIERRCIPFRHKRLPTGPTSASYFAGGACAIRRRAFDRAGLYDESLFYGGEELDLSYRLLEAGLGILFDPSVAVSHYAIGDRAESSVPYFYARNRPWVALRHLPLLCFVTHALGWWGWSLRRGTRDGTLGAAVRGIRDCLAGMPRIWRERRPISGATRRLIASNSGRLWY
jgi:GT2 family glycosyltransferase